ncbi:hypothetical protein GCM10011583_71030 [Streptomyces camponoticapitis]|uniref:Uncharacterized protein n=1 Tax=Streptomyces camponoticapitis TaxID=1616125 RepID=A0ABQ2EVW3_9ACTN|nr:hypothetical protein [Streptomyces camponoticapitis]GGK28860.1 hypothetical protein GCM10011583_71030 [Streptomyces camponoticapitis]
MSLPGADELFRTTGGMALQASSPGDRRRTANGEPRVPAPAQESDPGAEQPGAAQAAAPAPAPAQEHSATDADSSATSRSRTPERDQPQRRSQGSQDSGGGTGGNNGGTAAAGQQGGQRRRGGRGANRRPSGRERHDEKITVYVSAEELMDLEHARLVLRGEHGLAVDRGRIVREAVAVVLADLESRGDASILVRRLRGR